MGEWVLVLWMVKPWGAGTDEQRPVDIEMVSVSMNNQPQCEVARAMFIGSHPPSIDANGLCFSRTGSIPGAPEPGVANE